MVTPSLYPDILMPIMPIAMIPVVLSAGTAILSVPVQYLRVLKSKSMQLIRPAMPSTSPFTMPVMN